MDGEFLVEESVGIEKGIGGGNFILQSGSLDSGLAARRATDVIAGMANVIAPFPGESFGLAAKWALGTKPCGPPPMKRFALRL